MSMYMLTAMGHVGLSDGDSYKIGAHHVFAYCTTIEKAKEIAQYYMPDVGIRWEQHVGVTLLGIADEFARIKDVYIQEWAITLLPEDKPLLWLAHLPGGSLYKKLSESA